MSKLLTKIANDTKLQKATVFTGFALATISNILVYVGLYYSALKKGVEVRDQYYYEEECKAYKETQDNKTEE